MGSNRACTVSELIERLLRVPQENVVGMSITNDQGSTVTSLVMGVTFDEHSAVTLIGGSESFVAREMARLQGEGQR